MGPYGMMGGALGSSDELRALERNLKSDANDGYGAAPLNAGPSVHGAVGRLEESVEALQKVFTELGERLNVGGVLAPIASGADAANKTSRPASCGLEDRISVIRARVDRLASATVSVVQALQV